MRFRLFGDNLFKNIFIIFDFIYTFNAYTRIHTFIDGDVIYYCTQIHFFFQVYLGYSGPNISYIYTCVHIGHENDYLHIIYE